MSCGIQKPPFPVGFPWNQWFPVAPGLSHRSRSAPLSRSPSSTSGRCRSPLARWASWTALQYFGQWQTQKNMELTWIYLGILSDFTNQYRKKMPQNCLFLLGMSGLAHVGPKILIRNHEFSSVPLSSPLGIFHHETHEPPWTAPGNFTKKNANRYLTHREFSRTMST